MPGYINPADIIKIGIFSILFIAFANTALQSAGLSEYNA